MFRACLEVGVIEMHEYKTTTRGFVSVKKINMVFDTQRFRVRDAPESVDITNCVGVNENTMEVLTCTGGIAKSQGSRNSTTQTDYHQQQNSSWT